MRGIRLEKIENFIKEKRIPMDTLLFVQHEQKLYPVKTFYYSGYDSQYHNGGDWILQCESDEAVIDCWHDFDPATEKEQQWEEKMQAYIKNAPPTVETLLRVLKNTFNPKDDILDMIDICGDYEELYIGYHYIEGKLVFYNKEKEWCIDPVIEKAFYEDCLSIISKVKYLKESIPSSLISMGSFGPSDEDAWAIPSKLKNDLIRFMNNETSEFNINYEDAITPVMSWRGYQLFTVDNIMNDKEGALKDFYKCIFTICDWEIKEHLQIKRKYDNGEVETIAIDDVD
jgi:hypothetical protein